MGTFERKKNIEICTQNRKEICQNRCNWIAIMLRRFFGKKITSFGHSSLQHLPIAYISHNLTATTGGGVLFSTENAKFGHILTYWGSFVANFRTFWRTFYGPEYLWRCTKIEKYEVCTFRGDLHPPLGGQHPVIYVTIQTTNKSCTSISYTVPPAPRLLIFLSDFHKRKQTRVNEVNKKYFACSRAVSFQYDSRGSLICEL